MSYFLFRSFDYNFVSASFCALRAAWPTCFILPDLVSSVFIVNLGMTHLTPASCHFVCFTPKYSVLIGSNVLPLS
jgi:hypothetical protein